MDLQNIDLTFLIDRAKAIQLRNEVIDEYYSWGNLLSPEDENKYLLMIQQLTNIIDNFKGGNGQW